jgi:prefoldin subunit 5
MASQTPVCLYNKYGYCKHKEMCRKRHVNEMCEKTSCEVYKCTSRHPKICKFFWNQGHCKFDPCAFLHKDNDNSIWRIKQEHEVLQEKVNSIDKALTDLNKQENETQSSIDKISEVKSKLEDREHELDSLQKLVHETNVKFENLQTEIEKKFKSFEESLNILKKCVLEKDILIETLENKLNEKLDKNTTKVKCSKCNFEGSSKHGLKVHMARKHTLHFDSKSKKCELCDKDFENVREIKKHLKTHSYKKVEFKCVECDFVGASEETMEVHYGKSHSDSFECGICEYKAETFENLEIHLVTCEIFKCRYCDFNEKNLSEFKKHTAKEHNPGQFHTILHYKMDRTNQNEVCCNTLGWDKI